MAVVAKYQIYDSASHNWLSTTGACKDLNDELKAWIALVNANATSSGNPSAVLRDETSSTSANYYGTTVRMTDSSSRDTYMRFVTTTASNVGMIIADTWADDSGWNGYGTTSGYVAQDTSISFRTSGYEFREMVAYDTVDGKEFFVYSWYSSSTGYSDMFIIARTNEGGWAVVVHDGTAVTGMASTAGGHMKGSIINGSSASNGIPTPGLFLNNTQGIAGSGTNVDSVAFASLKLFHGRTDSFGDWAPIDAANDDYLLSISTDTGLWVRTN